MKIVFFVVGGGCAPAKLSHGRFVEGKVKVDPIDRKVGPELHNYLQSWPLVRARREDKKVHALALVSMSLLGWICTFYSSGG